MRLSDLASRLGLPLEGDGSVEVVRAAGVDEAEAGDLTYLAHRRHTENARTTRATAIILSRGAPALHLPALRAPDPTLAFAHAVALLHPAPTPVPGVHPTALVAASARLGPRAHVGAYVVIEDDVVVGADAWIEPHGVVHRGVRIGDGLRMWSRVVVHSGTTIGDRVELHSGAVIGCEGFGYARRPDGSYLKVPQVGRLVIEDDVEVQSNSCVDRGALGLTRLRRGVKVDNLVQVGHNCDLGEDSIVCGQSGLAGSTNVGRSVVLGGQVGVGGHLTIGDRVVVSAQTGVSTDVEAGAIVSGYPHMDNRQWRRLVAAQHRLPELLHEVRALRQRLDALDPPA